ncbi:hypothetical protein ABVK25_009583 [Lepraria finkii]|uniref:Uncharacterized protein n=1 Tax=Lepraria finkii TaxID=1340010 RepID=A0ABR4AZ51_9LECA
MFCGIVCVKRSYIGSNRDKSSRGFFKDAANWRNLAFATSCRQIYEEMSNVFYAQNGFEFSSGPPFLEFLKGIGRKGRKGRRTLTKLGFVNTTTGMPFIALRYLKPCENLHKCQSPGLFYVPLKQPLAFFLGDWKEIELGTGRMSPDPEFEKKNEDSKQDSIQDSIQDKFENNFEIKDTAPEYGRKKRGDKTCKIPY